MVRKNDNPAMGVVIQKSLIANPKRLGRSTGLFNPWSLGPNVISHVSIKCIDYNQLQLLAMSLASRLALHLEPL